MILQVMECAAVKLQVLLLLYNEDEGNVRNKEPGR